MDIAIRWQVAGGLIQQIGLSEGRRHLVVAAVREPVILFATQPAMLKITEKHILNFYKGYLLLVFIH